MDDEYHDIGIAEHFYEFPKVWFNAYHRDEAGAGETVPMMQIHLVDKLKSTTDWSEYFQEGSQERHPEIWDEARRSAELAGRVWWAEAEGGVKNMKFYWDC